MQRVPAALAVPGANVHLYGKSSRPGRKIGHVTVLGHDAEEAIASARRAAALLTTGDREAHLRYGAASEDRGR
jgi:phosphoribosylaminoimidazole carboxylase (NCAIR synthetase)